MKKLIIPLLAALVLFSGCVRMSATEQLKRDGSMNVLVIFDSAYFTITDTLNSSILPNPNLTSVTERINNTLIYYFSNVNPLEDDLFINANESNDLAINASGFLGGNTFKYTEKFIFPYYHYYYSADFGNISIESEQLNESFLLELVPAYTMEYDIIYFGELVSTNGQEVEKNRIRFTFVPSSKYELTFKEFFITNWISRLIE